MFYLFSAQLQNNSSVLTTRKALYVYLWCAARVVRGFRGENHEFRYHIPVVHATTSPVPLPAVHDNITRFTQFAHSFPEIIRYPSSCRHSTVLVIINIEHGV